MLISILIDVQYSQEAIFGFGKGSNSQNHSSSGSIHPVKKFLLPSKITGSPPTAEGNFPPPLTAIWKTLIPSHLLKVTKFIVKTSQFKLLVKIKKNIFCL